MLIAMAASASGGYALPAVYALATGLPFGGSPVHRRGNLLCMYDLSLNKMEKKEKKGFWASLFTPKSSQCSCGGGYVIPAEEINKNRVDAGNGSCQNVQEIKVLGPGCAKCKSTYAVVEKVVKTNGLDVQLTKVEDIEEIMHYNIMATPAIVVDGKVVMKGKVPTESEVKQILGI